MKFQVNLLNITKVNKNPTKNLIKKIYLAYEGNVTEKYYFRILEQYLWDRNLKYIYKFEHVSTND